MKILVTGATSGLGRSLVEYLHSNQYNVVATGRNLKAGNELQQLGIDFFSCDLGRTKPESNSLHDVDCVVHCAALSSPWGKYHDFHNANVVATEHIIDVCRKYYIKRLIHISTPSVYFNFEDRFNIRETDPLADKPANTYVTTKLIAEKIVMQANSPELETICLRPRGIIGPYDRAIVPRLLRLYKLNDTIPLINGGRNLTDISCVENVISAIVGAMTTGNREALGKCFNISNGSPIIASEFIKLIFNALGIQLNVKYIPYPLAYAYAAISEFFCRYIATTSEPILTRYTAGVAAKSQTLDITQAQKLLGYRPVVTIQDAIKNYGQHWKQYD